MELNEKLKRVVEFHGHLGPYLILGMRMGEFSNQILGKESGAGSGHSRKKAIVRTGTKPPVSCIIDGIQFTSGCTVGKGNLEVRGLRWPEVTFILDEKKLTLKIKQKPFTKDCDLEQVAMELYKKSSEDLFIIEKNF